MDCCENLVLYGPVGTGNTHLAVALDKLAWRDTGQVFHRDLDAHVVAPREAGGSTRHGVPADRRGEALGHRRVRLHVDRRGGLQALVPSHI